MAHTLIVAATPMELAPLIRLPGLDEVEAPLHGMRVWRGRLAGAPVELATTGVGTVAAATAIAAALATSRPRACWMTGIAGAYVGSFVPVGSVAVASDEVDLDAGIAHLHGMQPWEHLGFSRVAWDDDRRRLGDRVSLDPGESRRLAGQARIVPIPFATSDAVSGDLEVAHERATRSGTSVESMEGFAAAVACLRAGVPFAEARGISNVAGVRDKSSWETDRAIAATARVIVAALRTVA